MPKFSIVLDLDFSIQMPFEIDAEDAVTATEEAMSKMRLSEIFCLLRKHGFNPELDIRTLKLRRA